MKRLTILITLLLISSLGMAQDGSILATYKINAENEAFIKNESSYGGWAKGMCNIGDLDKDGTDDLAVGVIDIDNIDGAIAIYFMNNDGTVKDYSIIGENKGGLNTDIPNDFNSFGEGITSLGDFDGDGVNDIAAGNWGTNFGGEVFLLFLNTDGTVKSHKRIAAGVNGFNHALDNDEAFGSTVANIGDIDGNGVTDIAVGSKNKNHGGTSIGSIYIIMLNSDGTVKDYQEISPTHGSFNQPLPNYSNFGYSLLHYKDNRICVGTSSNINNRGSIWVIDLKNDGTVESKFQITDGKGGFSETLNPGSDFGFSLSLAGDINDDGIMDIMVGAPYYDDGGDETGAAFLLFMNTDGTVKSHIKYSNSTLPYTLATDDNFGTSVASMGDWNDDGKYDVAVGVFKEKYEGSNRGAVHLLFLDGKDQKVGINNISLTNINVYPNPANKSIKIDNTNLTNANYTVTIFDVTGRQVLLKNSTAIKQQEINIETLQEGVYHILITTDDNNSYQSKLVVQH